MQNIENIQSLLNTSCNLQDKIMLDISCQACYNGYIR